MNLRTSARRAARASTLIVVAGVGNGALAHEVPSLHGPHEHGVAELVVTRDGPSVRLTLVVSAADLAGFERAPETPRERKALRDGYRTLKRPGAWLASPCTLESVEVEAELLAREDHAASILDQLMGGAAEAPKPVGEDGHTDFQATYTYRCAGEARFDVNLFAAAPTLRLIRVHDGKLTGTARQLLTPSQREVVW